LTEKKTGTGFYVYNVHLACFSQNSREKSVQLLARRVALRKKSDPFIVTGDFNMGLDNSAMQYLQKNGYNTPYPKMVDAWQSVHSDKEYSGTYKSQKGPKLDHIPISENLLALDVKIDQRKENGRYPSDHFPVIAKILLNKPMFSQLKWNERTFE
jgi:endonuclease/exonuclease/phosphatase family metal-dependent hydrolase